MLSSGPVGNMLAWTADTKMLMMMIYNDKICKYGFCIKVFI